jgi:hypothetical protein
MKNDLDSIAQDENSWSRETHVGLSVIGSRDRGHDHTEDVMITAGLVLMMLWRAHTWKLSLQVALAFWRIKRHIVFFNANLAEFRFSRDLPKFSFCVRYDFSHVVGSVSIMSALIEMSALPTVRRLAVPAIAQQACCTQRRLFPQCENERSPRGARTAGPRHQHHCGPLPSVVVIVYASTEIVDHGTRSQGERMPFS